MSLPLSAETYMPPNAGSLPGTVGVTLSCQHNEYSPYLPCPQNPKPDFVWNSDVLDLVLISDFT